MASIVSQTVSNKSFAKTLFEPCACTSKRQVFSGCSRWNIHQDYQQKNGVVDVSKASCVQPNLQHVVSKATLKDICCSDD